ncbi:hypothetical protein CFM95_28300 [Klebsiella michiganensis]|nr:hypothetical protein [Klebsiella michiganensis]
MDVFLISRFKWIAVTLLLASDGRHNCRKHFAADLFIGLANLTGSDQLPLKRKTCDKRYSFVELVS